MATARTSTGTKFALTLDGVMCGFVDTIDGGDISADVIEEKVAGAVFSKKHIGQPKYEDFELELGLSLAQSVYDWIAATWRGDFQRKDGSITTADVDLNAKEERQFFHALVTEVTMPALDASSKAAARMTIRFAPELTKSAQASGKVAAVAVKQPRFQASNFRLELDGIDCTHVRKIDSFTVQVEVSADTVGGARDLGHLPGRLEFPNLRVTTGDGPPLASWQGWFHDFVVNGRNDDSQEKSGAIVFLGPDLKAELGRVVLHNVGIFALRAGPRPKAAETVASHVADLYCERMELVVGKPAPRPEPLRPVIAGVRPLGIRR
jgi:phage tail-like protein